jgi:hypothetical protein
MVPEYPALWVNMMSGTFPSCELILLEIQESFGLNDLQTLQKSRFVNLEKEMSEHPIMARSILKRILSSLRLSDAPQLLDDLVHSLEEIFEFHNAVGYETRTFGADAREIVWALLAYLMMPVLGCKYALRSLAEPVAPGMTHGDLWFLPSIDPSDSSRLRLPVQTVVVWWLDLLDQRLDKIWSHDQDKNWKHDKVESRVRALQYWRSGALPSRDAIDRYFSNEHQFPYQGAFPNNLNDSLDSRFRDALNFVRHVKRMDAKKLSHEIPTVRTAVFEAALSEVADDNVKLDFVTAVAQRWQTPSNETVRRRFLIARAMQDGYTRLVGLLTPGIKADCPDPARNKTLQLLALFACMYGLSMLTDECPVLIAESNNRFTEMVLFWLAEGPFKSIMSTEVPDPAEVGNFLTGRFRARESGAKLEDLFTDGDLSAGPAPRTEKRTVLAARQEFERLLERLTAAFDGDAVDRRERIEELLERVTRDPRAEEFEADILYCHGRHLLSCNDVDGAKEKFDAAFEACKRRGYGQLRKQIAYACLGAAVAFDPFNERTERYFRVIAHYLDPSEAHDYHSHGLERELPNLFREAAVRASEHFWKVVYRPYAGVDRHLPPDHEQCKQLLRGYFDVVMGDDQDALDQWVKQNRKDLEIRLRDVWGDTPFGVILKMTNRPDKILRDFAPQKDFRDKSLVSTRWRVGLYHLVSSVGKKALEIADFKRRTPLMEAADFGDARLVKILLDRNVDFDAQDCQGHTALHAAAASRSSECFLILLDKGADPSKTKATANGLSALDIAAKYGLVEAVSRTLARWPHRFDHQEIERLLKMTRHIHANYESCRRLLLAQERRVNGPKAAYKMIEDVLEQFLGKATNRS